MAKVFFTLVKIVILAAVLAVGINAYVIKSAEDQIFMAYDGGKNDVTVDRMDALRKMKPDCVLVLGASVNPDGTPSQMLQDRLDTAVALYQADAAPKLLLSGDNGQAGYNEVETMKNYVMEAGVPEEDIFLDHAGFSTYESVYRAGYIFQTERIIVVTQEYHLYRALYGCNRMGIEAVGVAAAQDVYAGQEQREIREVLARDKDCVKWLIKPEPTFLGDAIPISGSGTETH